MFEEIHSLRTVEWKKTYKSTHRNLAKDFLIPALERSILYKRVAGYFSSSILPVAASGIARLIMNGGEMQLIVGVDLSEKDVNAINDGQKSVESHVLRQIPLELSDYDNLRKFFTEERYKALYWLIANGRLKIKVAVVVDDNENVSLNQEQRIFHDKWGIFYDAEGNKLGFSGSVNETKAAWYDNHERFKVFKGWTEEFEYLEEDLNDFEAYWEDSESGIRVLDVTEAIEKELIRYRNYPAPIIDPVEDKKGIVRTIEKKERITIKSNKLEGSYKGVKFLSPNMYENYIKGQIISSVPHLDHEWNSLLQTVMISPMEHQTYIAHEVYENFPRSYLLCDEVGLGKTIEAGFALKWLLFSGKIRRVLIIVPKNLLKQWQEEIYEKFNLEFLIYDGKDLITYWNEQLIPQTTNHYNNYNLILVSSGLVTIDKRSEVLLNAYDWDLIIFDEAHHIRRKSTSSKSRIGSPGKLLKLANKLKYKTRSFLLLTATPIQINIGELFDLLGLLDLGGKWGIREYFNEYYSTLGLSPQSRTKKQWEFLIEMAIDFLKWGRTNTNVYKKEIRGLEIRPRYFRELLSIFIRNDDITPYLEKHKNNKEFFRELNNELEALSPLRWFMFRNTREQLKDYGINVPIRKTEDKTIKMKLEEKKLYKKLERYIIEIYNKAEESQKSLIGFTLSIYRRRLTSSFNAIKKTLEKRKTKIEKYMEKDIEEDYLLSFGIDEEELNETIISDDNIYSKTYSKVLESKNIDTNKQSIIFDFGFEEDVNEKQRRKDFIIAKDSLEEEIKYISSFIDEIENFLESNVETKFVELKNILLEANVEDAKRVLVFTQYTDTIDFLKEKIIINPNFLELGVYTGKGGELLKKAKNKSRFFWEKCSKEKIKKWFIEEGSFKIMLCTDAASEGLNFHICNWLINYDLPWNPMKVEQRIGRIDRVKQKNKFLIIYNLMYDDSIEGRIYQKLWERIRLFQNAIGPLRPILDVYQKANQFAISEGDEKLTENQVEILLGNIREEMERAEKRHEFFQNLLKKRLMSTIEDSRAKGPFIERSDYFDWFKSFLETGFYKQILNISEELSFNTNSDPISIQFEEENIFKVLFLPKYRTALKKNVKFQFRNLDLPKLSFNFTTNIKIFDELESSYYLALYSLFFQNIMKKINSFKKHKIPIIFSKPFKEGDILKDISVLTRIDFSVYPSENKSCLFNFQVNLKKRQVTSFKVISSFEEVNQLVSKTSNYCEKSDFIEKKFDETDNIKTSILNILSEFLKHSKDMNVKELLLSEKTATIIEPMNWKEIKHSEGARTNTRMHEFEKKIIQWLIMDFFKKRKFEDWNNLPRLINFKENIDALESSREGWKFKQIIKTTNIERKIEFTKRDHIFISEFIDTYKNKKKIKLLAADQERLRLNILEIYDTFINEQKRFRVEIREYIKALIINKPKIIVIGFII